MNFMPRGYFTSQGFTGILPDGTRIAFATQDDYMEYVEAMYAEAV